MFKELSKYKKESFKRFEGANGMNTKFWGKALWDFLFTSVLGRYPVEIDNNNKIHLRIKEEYMNMIYSLEYVLPCIYCRESFSKFIKQYPPENYNNGRIELFYWLSFVKV